MKRYSDFAVSLKPEFKIEFQVMGKDINTGRWQLHLHVMKDGQIYRDGGRWGLLDEEMDTIFDAVPFQCTKYN